MKYMIICTIAFLICLAFGFCIASWIMKKRKGMMKKVVLTIVFCILTMGILSFSYLSVHSHAGEKAEQALEGNTEVTVEKVNGGWYFDGPSDSQAIVFYQGAKVDCRAYAPLMLYLAEEGFDCFLADMPFCFAIFDGNLADDFLKAYSYDTWIMAGHSMGGIMAASYAEEHKDQIDGILLLASYTSIDIDDDIKLCSIYGTEDGCLQKSEYDKNKGCWPKDAYEYVIEGGNHAQFGDYGEQRGDGKAEISFDKQQKETVKAVLEYFGSEC